jgi:hypothetical protein
VYERTNNEGAITTPQIHPDFSMKTDVSIPALVYNFIVANTSFRHEKVFNDECFIGL